MTNQESSQHIPSENQPSNHYEPSNSVDEQPHDELEVEQDEDDSDHNDDDDETENDEDDHHAGTAEAGLVRGVSRSVAQRAVAARSAGRTMAKLPSVGKLPRSAGRAMRRRGVPAAKPPSATPRLQVVKIPTSRTAKPKMSVTAAKPRIPRPSSSSTATTTRVPVKRVAKLTDRMSTGLDLWETAVATSGESDTTTTTTKSKQQQQQQQQQLKKIRRQLWHQRWMRFQNFATSLVKNSILGAIVFETYCHVVTESETLLPFLKSTTSGISSNSTIDNSNNHNQRQTKGGDMDQPQHNLLENDNDHDRHHNQTDHPHHPLQTQTQKILLDDVFGTTPVATHYLAGATAGSLQAVGTLLWDTVAVSWHSKRLSLPLGGGASQFASSLGQHAAAHSILFGSYESWKRLFLSRIVTAVEEDGSFGGDATNMAPRGTSNTTSTADTTTTTTLSTILPHQRVEYFTAIALAGGLAGQLQHVCSHVLEQQPYIHIRQIVTGVPTSPRIGWATLLPSLRSTLWAFPPSAIAFLAFEYGKDAVLGDAGSSE